MVIITATIFIDDMPPPPLVLREHWASLEGHFTLNGAPAMAAGACGHRTGRFADCVHIRASFFFPGAVSRHRCFSAASVKRERHAHEIFTRPASGRMTLPRAHKYYCGQIYYTPPRFSLSSWAHRCGLMTRAARMERGKFHILDFAARH